MKVPEKIMRARTPDTGVAFGIKQIKDGWVVVQILMGNGKYMTKPAPKTLAIEQCKMYQAREWWS